MFGNLSLNEACKEQHEMVIAKGFEPQPVATNLMLIVSELGEACVADRKNHHAHFEGYDSVYIDAMNKWGLTSNPVRSAFREAFERDVKDSFEDEIADAFLRLMDLCGALNIDIEKHIRLKAEYNLSRPPKHGKAY